MKSNTQEGKESIHDDQILLSAMKENERITGANNSQPVNKGWGRRGNLGFPTDDRILRNEMTENERSNTITISHPQIVEFFKDTPPNEIDEFIMTCIELSNKCMKVCTKSPTIMNSTKTAGDVSNSEKDSTEEITGAQQRKMGMTEEEKTEMIKVNKYVLHEINKEYQEFVRSKDALIGVLKENGKQSFGLVNEMKMPYLEKYICETCDTELSTKLQIVNQFKCEVCNYYICNTKKALSAHQRGCKRNMVNM